MSIKWQDSVKIIEQAIISNEKELAFRFWCAQSIFADKDFPSFNDFWDKLSKSENAELSTKTFEEMIAESEKIQEVLK